MYYDEQDFFTTVFSWFKLKESDYDRFDVNMCNQELARMLSINEEKTTEDVENAAEVQYLDELDDAKEEAREEAFGDCKKDYREFIEKKIQKQVDKFDGDENYTEDYNFWARVQEELETILNKADNCVDPY